MGIIENSFNLNPFEAIGKKWMLITAKDGERVNTMTASWGGMGVIWGENVVYISPISTQTLLKRIQNSKIE